MTIRLCLKKTCVLAGFEEAEAREGFVEAGLEGVAKADGGRVV